MDKEIIIDVIGYEGHYKISNFGYVISVKDGKSRIMVHGTNQGGYLTVVLTINAKPHTYMLHRLIAKHFVDNPDNKPWVNHLDCDRKNARASNLVWCTPYENYHHIGPNGKKSGAGKQIVNIKTGEVFLSTVAAHKNLGKFSKWVFLKMLRNPKINFTPYRYYNVQNPVPKNEFNCAYSKFEIKRISCTDILSA